MSRKKSKAKSSRYKIWMLPTVHTTRKRLPGHVRQRIKQILTNLGKKPRPTPSKILRLPDTLNHSLPAEWEIRRYRVDDWRIIYAINETWQEIGVLAIRKRPPYDYEDLTFLLSHLL